MSTAPQPHILPQYVDPRKLAARQVVLQGQIPPESLTRLARTVLSIEEPVSVQIRFGRNLQGRWAVSGTAKAQVSLQCQRCLDPVLVPLDAGLAVTLVWSDDEAKSLPRAEEAWLVEAEEANLWELVEDELILALPIVGLHDKGCEISSGYGVDSMPETEQEERHNPFEVLAKLKR